MSRPALITRSVLGLSLVGGVALAVTAQATPSASYSVHGIDISRYQHPGGAAINWAQVKASGVKFVIVGATQGTSSTPANSYFQADYAAAKANGLIRGAYHFATPSAAGGSLQTEATSEAKALLTAIGGTRTHEAGDMAPVLDLETRDGLSDADLVTWTKAFAVEVYAETGRQPILYVSACFFATGCTGAPSSLKYLPTWVAAYTTDPSPTARGWSMWQYSSSASVPGISGAVDMNVFNSTQSALVNAFGDGRTPALVALWGLTGGPKGSLGAAQGDESQIAYGTWVQEYANGTSVYSAATGAMPLFDEFRAYWKQHGAVTGLPTAFPANTPGGVIQTFQAEDLFNNGTGTAFPVSGDVRTLWHAQAAAGTSLGVPLTAMVAVAPDLATQTFENGTVIRSPVGLTVLRTTDPAAVAHFVAAADGADDTATTPSGTLASTALGGAPVGRSVARGKN